jgi:hypothetical protein
MLSHIHIDREAGMRLTTVGYICLALSMVCAMVWVTQIVG